MQRVSDECINGANRRPGSIGIEEDDVSVVVCFGYVAYPLITLS